jgi:antitoxin (DNA-binding transcriptional repressor) of toxin-antitoxin stability system
LFEKRSSPHTVKVIPLSEAKANLSRYGRLCQEEPVIVTINGVPSFQLAPLEEDDDLIDRLLAENPEFGQLLGRRSRERTVSANEARKRR